MSAQAAEAPQSPAPLGKLSKGALADRWGALEVAAEPIAEEIKALKGEFERRGLIVAEGAAFVVMKTASSFDALNIPAIRAEMGAAWCAKRSERRERESYKVTAIGALKARPDKKARAK